MHSGILTPAETGVALSGSPAFGIAFPTFTRAASLGTAAAHSHSQTQASSHRGVKQDASHCSHCPAGRVRRCDSKVNSPRAQGAGTCLQGDMGSELLLYHCFKQLMGAVDPCHSQF